jgi:AcrR family transcriptional regulator
MRLSGASTDEICKRLGVETRTVYIWFSDPLVKAALAEQVRRVNESFAEQLAAASVKALGELLDFALQPATGPPTPELNFKMLREIVELARPQAARRDSRDAEDRRPFADLTDDQLIGCAQQMARQIVAETNPGPGVR